MPKVLYEEKIDQFQRLLEFESIVSDFVKVEGPQPRFGRTGVESESIKCFYEDFEELQTEIKV